MTWGSGDLGKWWKLHMLHGARVGEDAGVRSIVISV